MKTILKLSLINCGYITEHLAYTKLNITSKYLNSLVCKNELEKNPHMLFGKMNYIYTLSKNSLRNIRNEGYNIYKHDSTQLEHDYLLQKVFLSLTEKEMITWQNETTLKNKFGKKSTTSDAIFIRDNKIIGVEILTTSYEKDQINSKMQFISQICDDDIILNTKDFSWR